MEFRDGMANNVVNVITITSREALIKKNGQRRRKMISFICMLSMAIDGPSSLKLSQGDHRIRSKTCFTPA